MANNGIGMGAITYGFDHNFFQKVSVTATSFNSNADLFIPFVTQGVMLLNLGSGVVEVSLNGNTVHMELNSTNASAGLTFDNRVVGKMWFRVQSGSSGPIVISVSAWERQ
jgi:hypothetical protein